MPGQIIRSWWIVFGILIVVLGYVVHQDQFFLLAGFILLLFTIYFFIGIRYPEYTRVPASINILLKVILVFAFPLASDDIFRFYWDGCTVLDGISPFKYKPVDLIQIHPAAWQTDYDKLNSTEYYSVYPPVLQGIFAICAYFSFHSIYLFGVLWKIFLLAADLVTIHLFKKVDSAENTRHLYWFAWNPLIMYEVLVNGHSEGLMVCFLVASVYWLKKTRFKVSAILISFAAAIKIFPIVLLLFIPKYIGIKPALKYTGLSVFLFILWMIPVYPFQRHLLESLQLYFGRFEFNGSLFEIWKAIDYWRFGYDNAGHIAPFLSVIFILVCVALFFKQKKEDRNSFYQSLLFTWFAYLLLSTTVHPWYIIPLFVLGLMANQYYIIIWTAGIILSYSWYSPGMNTDWKYFFILVEYMLVFTAFMFKNKISKLISGRISPDLIWQTKK